MEAIDRFRFGGWGGSDNQRAEMTLPIAPAHWKYHLIRAIATASA